jgi:hypothetical protein
MEVPRGVVGRLAHVWGEATHLGGPRVRNRLVFKDLLAAPASEGRKT